MTVQERRFGFPENSDFRYFSQFTEPGTNSRCLASSTGILFLSSVARFRLRLTPQKFEVPLLVPTRTHTKPIFTTKAALCGWALRDGGRESTRVSNVFDASVARRCQGTYISQETASGARGSAMSTAVTYLWPSSASHKSSHAIVPQVITRNATLCRIPNTWNVERALQLYRAPGA